MVKGLDILRAHFQNHANRYVLIGGTACDIASGGQSRQAQREFSALPTARAADYCELGHD